MQIIIGPDLDFSLFLYFRLFLYFKIICHLLIGHAFREKFIFTYYIMKEFVFSIWIISF